MKKYLFTLAILMTALIANGLTITTTNNAVIVGEITAKLSGSFFVTTPKGSIEVPVNSISSIMEGNKDMYIAYLSRPDFAVPLPSNDLDLDSLTTFEREIIREMKNQTITSRKTSQNIIFAAIICSATYAITQAILYNLYKF